MPCRLSTGAVAPARPQGLRLQAGAGELVVNGHRLADVVLWSDTSPAVVVVGVEATDRVKLWNVWRDDRDTMHAWLGNAGMLVEETGHGIVLRCSDGAGEPTFDDLVATIEVVDA